MTLLKPNMLKLSLYAAVAFVFMYAGATNAQDNIDSIASMASDEAKIEIVKLPQPPISQLKPLFWNNAELSIISQIKRGVIKVVPIDDSLVIEDLLNDGDIPIITKTKKYKVPRDLRLSALIYNSKDDWSVWLNGMKITPDSDVTEVRYLNVNENYIEIKWFDAVTNKIYPVRIKPDQRYNIDTGLFLPM